MMSAAILPWRASDGAVRKNRPLSLTSDSAGEVADGEIITTPFGSATFLSTAPVTPEQSAPMIATTLSCVTRRSAAEVATDELTQVELARSVLTVSPFRNLPESLTSCAAASAPAAIDGVIDSIGPVKPSRMPTFTSSAKAGAAATAATALASSNFFMSVSPWFDFGSGQTNGTIPD